MAFTLPPLPYDVAALEPHIDAKTMEIHHTKHHQAYIDNVNKAIKNKADLEKKSVEDFTATIPAVPLVAALPRTSGDLPDVGRARRCP